MTEKLLSFAECMAKLELISKKLTPEMKDVSTQTDFLYLLTEKEKQALDKTVNDFRSKWTDTMAKLRDAWDKHYDTKVELDNTRNALAAETVAKEDAIIRNENLQALYTSKTTELKTKIEDLNKDMDEMAINYAKTNSVREEEMKKLAKEAKEVREQLDKIKNVEKVSVEIQTKPEMVNHWVQTKLTAEQITQMEKDLEYRNKLLYQGAMEIEKLEQGINQKINEINQLKEQVKNTKLNPTEKRLMEVPIVLHVVIHDNYEHYQNLSIKQITFLTSGKLEGEVWDWSQLSKPFYDLKTKLIWVYQNFGEMLSSKSKLKKETEARNQLQTKYDMEVRSKEELANELKNIRPKVISEDERFILETLKKHGVQDRRQKAKEILDKAGFNRSKLGNSPFPLSGYTAYYYLYWDWTVPAEWRNFI